MTTFETLTEAQRQALLDARARLKTKTLGVTWTTAQLDDLLRVDLDLLTLTIDQPGLTAEDNHFSLGFNADGYPNAPEYRHEVLWELDSDYREAWNYDHAPGYAAEAEADPQTMAAVNAGRIRHPYREADPGIVDRSLLRHDFRQQREGESFPVDVLAKHAPKVYAALPSLVSESVVPELTIT